MWCALDRRYFNGLRRSNCIDAFRVICVAVNFDAMLCADFISVLRSTLRFFVCFFETPTRFSEILNRFRAKCKCAANVNDFAQDVRSFYVLRCFSDFQDEERIYAFTSYSASIYGRLANVIAVRLVLYYEERDSVAFFAPEFDSFCVFTAMDFNVFTSATAMRILRFRSMVRFYTISAIQVVSMTIEIKRHGCFAARFRCFFYYVLDCIAEA